MEWNEVNTTTLNTAARHCDNRNDHIRPHHFNTIDRKYCLINFHHPWSSMTVLLYVFVKSFQLGLLFFFILFGGKMFLFWTFHWLLPSFSSGCYNAWLQGHKHLVSILKFIAVWPYFGQEYEDKVVCRVCLVKLAYRYSTKAMHFQHRHSLQLQGAFRVVVMTLQTVVKSAITPDSGFNMFDFNLTSPLAEKCPTQLPLEEY